MTYLINWALEEHGAKIHIICEIELKVCYSCNQLCECLLGESPLDFLEKAMAPHSSTVAWKIPWTEEPGRLQSMGSLRVRHHWATTLSLFTFMHWRRKQQPTPVLLTGESQGRGNPVGCCLWGRTGSDMTEAMQQHWTLCWDTVKNNQTWFLFKILLDG